MSERDTTKKMPAISSMDEKEYVRAKYNAAKARLNPKNNPTQADIDAFIEASVQLKYTLSAYELAQELLKDRAFDLQQAFNSVFGR